MVALTESSLICSDLLRAHPRERGTILATIAETTVPALFPQQTATDTQRLQGESLSFTANLHPPNQSNQQYSILSLSDSSGAVVERVAYQAYGQPTFTNATGTTLSSSAKATRYSYTGREWDLSLQLHHFRARWMSGLSGRFFGRDPIGYTTSKSLYLSLFALSQTDPIGTDVFDIRIYPGVDITSGNSKLGNQPCGTTVSESYSYRFGNGAPFIGWIVQEVVNCCRKRKCKC